MSHRLKRCSLRRVVSAADYSEALVTRFEGYGRHYDFGSALDTRDPRDHARNSTILVFSTSPRRTVGTIRILDRRLGSVELDDFIDVDAMLRSRGLRSCAEATRFTVTVPNGSGRRRAKLLLARAFYDYCRLNGVDAMILSSAKHVARFYETVGFQDVGEEGEYRHPLLGNRRHRTYLARTDEMKGRWCGRCHPLYSLMCQGYPDWIPYGALLRLPSDAARREQAAGGSGAWPAEGTVRAPGHGATPEGWGVD